MLTVGQKGKLMVPMVGMKRKKRLHVLVEPGTIETSIGHRDQTRVGQGGLVVKK